MKSNLIDDCVGLSAGREAVCTVTLHQMFTEFEGTVFTDIDVRPVSFLQNDAL